jgi:hypothetical protein
MNKKNKYIILAAIAFLMAFFTKAIETYVGYDLSLERYILVGIVFPLFVMIHFIHHLRNPDFYENKKEYKFLSVIYKYVFIPSCVIYIFAGTLFV